MGAKGHDVHLSHGVRKMAKNWGKSSRTKLLADTLKWLFLRSCPLIPQKFDTLDGVSVHARRQKRGMQAGRHGFASPKQINAIVTPTVDVFDRNSKAKFARASHLLLRAPAPWLSTCRRRCLRPSKTLPQFRHGATAPSSFFSGRHGSTKEYGSADPS